MDIRKSYRVNKRNAYIETLHRISAAFKLLNSYLPKKNILEVSKNTKSNLRHAAT